MRWTSTKFLAGDVQPHANMTTQTRLVGGMGIRLWIHLRCLEESANSTRLHLNPSILNPHSLSSCSCYIDGRRWQPVSVQYDQVPIWAAQAGMTLGVHRLRAHCQSLYGIPDNFATGCHYTRYQQKIMPEFISTGQFGSLFSDIIKEYNVV
jgi:hypothetical protein